MNTKMTIALICAVVALSTGAARAADWQPVGAAGERLAVYEDGGSIRQGAGGLTRITALEDFGRVQCLREQVGAHG